MKRLLYATTVLLALTTASTAQVSCTVSSGSNHAASLQTCTNAIRQQTQLNQLRSRQNYDDARSNAAIVQQNARPRR